MTRSPPIGSRHWSPRLIEAAAALHENRLDVAERLLKPHLKEDPFDVRAIRMLAELAARIGRLKDSEKLLRRALEIDPNFTSARANLALVLGRLGRPAEALELLDELFQTEPDAPGHLSLKAATLGRLGEFEEALQIYEKVLERTPNRPRVLLTYGHLLKTVGQLDQSIEAYRKAIALKPDLGEGWWSLANLKTMRFEDADIRAMRSALQDAQLKDDDRFHIEFALGKALHDSGQSDEAFLHYASGNALRRRYHPFRSGDLTSLVDRSIELFSAELLSRPGGCSAADSIFIVGMPRAGSTLIEQILSSHSLVEGTAELADMPALARGRGRYPASAVEMNRADRTAAGEEYLRRTAVPNGRSLSTSCPTTGCLHRSSIGSCPMRRSSMHGDIRLAAAWRTSASISHADRILRTTLKISAVTIPTMSG
jgi:predicted Zn-dependent protease